MKRILLAAYLIAIHTLLIAALTRSDFLSRVQARLGVGNLQPPEITDHYRRMLRYHERIDGNVPPGSAIFIGDSLIQGLCVSAVASAAVNYGIGSDTTLGVLQRLPRYQSISNARVIVLEAGINDLARGRSEEQIIDNYKQCLLLIGRIPTIVNAIFLVDERALGKTGLNQKIFSTNTKIRSLCAATAGCYFLDINAQLADASGNLASTLRENDGIHLNSAGNALWLAALGQAMEKTVHDSSAGIESAGKADLRTNP